MRSRRTLLVFISIAVIVLALGTVAAARVRVVEHWALYASQGSGNAQQHLLLEPFPDKRTCQAEGGEIERAGGRASCRAYRELSFDPGKERRLFAEFFSPENPLLKFCGKRPS